MNIIIFDTQDITRYALQMLIPDVFRTPHPIRTVESKNELVQMLVANPESVVVIDYTLSDVSGADSLLNIAVRFPNTHWVLFSEDLSVQFLKKVLCNDEFSVVLKSSELTEIKKTISLAAEKLPYVCSQVKELLAVSNKNTASSEVLTLTEIEILREIAVGKSAKEIAALRNISAHTVVTHRKNIYRKLEVNNSHEAAGYALRAGILDTSDYTI
ncbi:MAG: response regulator transcription factor [Bacteroidales bacterium]|jgi:DNA-binding NarL/FixJ family response regulator|nr:response regulator transcription factor [Bacteroidales bacterium]